MKMTFLGTGSFFSTDNYHTNILLEDENNNSFLIDCGSDIKWSLKDAGKDPGKIEAVYISHMHADHFQGLEYLGYYGYFISKKIPTLFAYNQLIYPIWSALSHSMVALDDKNANLSTYFDAKYISFDNNAIFNWKGIKFALIPSLHIKCPKNIVRSDCEIYSYGLSFEINEKKIWITTDNCELNFKEDCEKYIDSMLSFNYFYHDIIFHDCETFECSNVHSHYSNLKKLPEEIKKKMWLVHYQNLGHKMPDAEKDGFAGFVKKGQIFEL